MKLDILAFAAHPDDVELGCSGTLLKHIRKGYKAGIIDLTRGEMGTRGSAAIRLAEVKDATKILGISVRENLAMKDGFFQNDPKHQVAVIEMIRKYRPEIVFANAVHDRHPDHGKAAQLVSESCFLAGLVKVDTRHEGKKQAPWRPRAVYHYIQDRHLQPNIIVDISEEIDQKLKCILAYKSQFYNPESKEPETAISSKEFLEFLLGRARDMGRTINARYGEGFTMARTAGIDDIFLLK
jgi:bacillithiol biosynthesis deacetylase BshB1